MPTSFSLSSLLLLPPKLSRTFTSKPSNEDNIPIIPLNKPDSKSDKKEDTPISERPDWVLIGLEDAINVFRLNEAQLKGLASIRKEDPYDDDKIGHDDIATMEWYYIRDVWEKSCELYGTDVVNNWYEKYQREVEQKLHYEAVYGWRHKDAVIPPETPLFRWLYSHKLNELLGSDDFHSDGINIVESGGREVVKRAIRANVSKFAITFALYLYTSSYSLWAETLHSFCDVTNQLLLLLSIKLASADPDWNHPYGYGASRWVVSFLSGTILCGMGLSAIHGSFGPVFEGAHAIYDVRVGILLCVVSAMLESYSFLGAYREIKSHIKKRQSTYSISQYLAHGTDSTSIHVFLEDAAGLTCSVIAGLALTATHFTNYNTVLYDAGGSAVIGCCLTAVGAVLMLRNGKLLSGRSVQTPIVHDVIDILKNKDVVASFHDIKSMIVGMNTCVVKVEINFNADRIAERNLGTSLIFDDFNQKIKDEEDFEVFHDLIMKLCADYQQWLILERALLELDIKKCVKNYGYERVHVDIETY